MTDERFTTYVIHFDPPVGRARHYTGSTPSWRLGKRLQEHGHGYGALLLRRALRQGSRLWLVYLEEATTRDPERRIKRAQSAARLCHLCRPSRDAPPYGRELLPHPTARNPHLCRTFGQSLASHRS